MAKLLMLLFLVGFLAITILPEFAEAQYGCYPFCPYGTRACGYCRRYPYRLYRCCGGGGGHPYAYAY